jgi:hypothetical protein
MMEDAMDGIMDDEESEEDTERIVAGVFDELNIQIAEQLGPVPVGGGLAAKAKVHSRWWICTIHGIF